MYVELPRVTCDQDGIERILWLRFNYTLTRGTSHL